jgi:hypothetical protein
LSAFVSLFPSFQPFSVCFCGLPWNHSPSTIHYSQLAPPARRSECASVAPFTIHHSTIHSLRIRHLAVSPRLPAGRLGGSPCRRVRTPATPTTHGPCSLLHRMQTSPRCVLGGSDFCLTARLDALNLLV